MELQTALLIFIVLFALAIGFFLGLFLISLDAPFLRKLFLKEESGDTPTPEDTETGIGEMDDEIEIKKPSPTSQLVLKVWQEEGQAPVYEQDGKYLEKEDLPQDILNVITIHAEETAEPEKPKSIPEPIEAEPVSKAPQEPEEDEEETEIKMLSVVDEVNEILQRKLHGSPMAGKGIHLMENHNKEIRFWVGLESFNDVSEIPDPEIRALIDAAVKEWEQNRE
jgi:hypothetical protein